MRNFKSIEEAKVELALTSEGMDILQSIEVECVMSLSNEDEIIIEWRMFCKSNRLNNFGFSILKPILDLF